MFSEKYNPFQMYYRFFDSIICRRHNISLAPYKGAADIKGKHSIKIHPHAKPAQPAWRGGGGYHWRFYPLITA